MARPLLQGPGRRSPDRGRGAGQRRVPARLAAREAALGSQRERELFERDRAELERTRSAFDHWTRWVNALRPGDAVFIKTLKRPGKVVRMQLQKQKALVSAGAMDIEVPISDIDTPPPEE